MDTRRDEIHAEACTQMLYDKTHHHPGATNVMEVLLGALTTNEFEKFCDNTPDGVGLWRAYQEFALKKPNCHILDFAYHILAELPEDDS